MLHNLITNAVRYPPGGSPIEVGMARSSSGVDVWVGDDGPGIPAERAQSVFSKFTSFDETATGAGLGLYIARTIARAHGGDVLLGRQPSGGARFTLRLPTHG
ncbi:MAG: hypothetical protein GEU78_15710 [Actinobacteria bacterium]|nr:hypothetical protein [Actinomycetota bacterium]